MTVKIEEKTALLKVNARGVSRSLDFYYGSKQHAGAELWIL